MIKMKIPALRIDQALNLWGARIIALFTLAVGAINLTSAVQPALPERLALIEAAIPLGMRHGSRLASALAGFGLLLLAGSLWRRKQVAWWLTLLLVLVSAVFHLVKGLDYEEASLSLALLVLLLLTRHSFHAISDRPSQRQGLLALAAAFGFTLVYGTAGFFLLDRHYSVQFDLLDALRQTVVMFTSFSNPGLEPLTGFGRYFAGSIYVIGAGTLAFALLMLVRPVLVRLPATPEERSRAEQIVQQHGRTSLARAALFEDKSYFFATESTVVAYGARGRGALALGDPIGPPEQVKDAIKSFRDFCARNDWQPAFASVLPDFLDDYRAAGFDVICIGYEAIVELGKFTLQGGPNKDLRYASNRLLKAGYEAKVHQPPLDSGLVQALREVSDAWLAFHHGGEMHFSDGWFHDAYIRGGPAAVVHAPDGKPVAFANLVPEYQKNELTIDLMRHYRSVEHGTMEFLFAHMLQWAKDNGYTTFSLGLSAIVGVGENPEDPRVEKALHTIAEYGSRFFNFKGLHDFKEKFHPAWEPRYLVYPGVESLPLVLTTLLKVHSGENFLWKYLPVIRKTTVKP